MKPRNDNKLLSMINIYLKKKLQTLIIEKKKCNRSLKMLLLFGQLRVSIIYTYISVHINTYMQNCTIQAHTVHRKSYELCRKCQEINNFIIVTFFHKKNIKFHQKILRNIQFSLKTLKKIMHFNEELCKKSAFYQELHKKCPFNKGLHKTSYFD